MSGRMLPTRASARPRPYASAVRRRAGVVVAIALATVAVVGFVAQRPFRRAAHTRSVTVRVTTAYPNVTSPPTIAMPRTSQHLEGIHSGTEHFALFTGRCAFLDHHLDESVFFRGSLRWQFHADYCGEIHGDLWSGAGTFTLAAPDGAALTGAFTDSARLPTSGVPYELDVTGGIGRFAGATGSCTLETHLRAVAFGVQDQWGAVVCDVRV